MKVSYSLMYKCICTYIYSMYLKIMIFTEGLTKDISELRLKEAWKTVHGLIYFTNDKLFK